MNITNQIERAKQIEKSDAALEKAKKQEKDLIEKGYRFFSVNGRTKIMVECDADGNPTERGQRVIESLRNQMGL